MTTRDRALLLLLFVGCITLVLEVRFEHRYVIKNPETWQSWIPLIYASLAALACLIGMASKKTPRTIAATIFFLGFIVSGIGLYFHTRFDPLRFQKFLMPYAQVLDAKGQPIVLTRPLAAPLSMAGLAGIGFVITSGLFKAGRSGSKSS